MAPSYCARRARVYLRRILCVVCVRSVLQNFLSVNFGVPSATLTSVLYSRRPHSLHSSVMYSLFVFLAI